MKTDKNRPEKEANLTYRGVLLKAKGNRWLWPSYIVSVVLIIMIPIIKGWGNFNALPMMLMMMAMLVLCVLLASIHQVRRFNMGIALLFTFIVWSNSSPTEGIGTYFYTDAQIERFQRAEEMRLIALKASKIRQEASSYSNLNYSDLKAHLPENFDSENSIIENNGKVEALPVETAIAE